MSPEAAAAVYLDIFDRHGVSAALVFERGYLAPRSDNAEADAYRAELDRLAGERHPL